MKVVNLLVLMCVLASTVVGFASPDPHRVDDVLVFSTLTLVQRSQYPPETKLITLIQSPSGFVRADIDNVAFLSAPEGLILLDRKSRSAVRVKGGKMSDIFRSIAGVSRGTGVRTISSKVIGSASHLGYRCRIIQRETEEDGLRSRRIEWVARIGTKDILLRRVETAQGWYIVLDAYQIIQAAPQKWLTIPSDYSVKESQSIIEAMRMIAASGD